MSKPEIFIITGISGSGKTTVARSLIEHGEIAFDSKLNPGLFHFESPDGHIPATNHPNDPACKSAHKWVIDRQLFDRLCRQHADSGRVFLCGGGDSLKALWPDADKVFLLQIDTSTLLARLNDPSRDNHFAKNTATQQILLNRLEKFQSNQLANGAIPVDARRPLPEIINEILEQAS